jgi:hypothetical protein
MLNSEHIKLWKWTHILSNKVHSETLNYFLKQYSIASFDVICYILQKMRKEDNQIQYHMLDIYTQYLRASASSYFMEARTSM